MVFTINLAFRKSEYLSIYYSWIDKLRDLKQIVIFTRLVIMSTYLWNTCMWRFTSVAFQKVAFSMLFISSVGRVVVSWFRGWQEGVSLHTHLLPFSYTSMFPSLNLFLWTHMAAISFLLFMLFLSFVDLSMWSFSDTQRSHMLLPGRYLFVFWTIDHLTDIYI